MATINDYISTIQNPRGMFLTLGNSMVLCFNQNNEPDCWVENNVAYFRVRIGGAKHLMLCFLGDKLEARERYKFVSLRIKSLKSPFIQRWKFLHDEMKVLTIMNRLVSCDVIIQKEIKSQSLTDFLFSTAQTNDKESVIQFLKGLAKMASEFYRKGINTKGIDFCKLRVQQDNMPLLSDCFDIDILSQPYPSNVELGDQRDFCTFASIISMFCIHPHYFMVASEKHIFGSQSREFLLKLIKEFAVQNQLHSLVCLSEGRVTNKKISDEIQALSEINFDLLESKFLELMPNDSCDFAQLG